MSHVLTTHFWCPLDTLATPWCAPLTRAGNASVIDYRQSPCSHRFVVDRRSDVQTRLLGVQRVGNSLYVESTYKYALVIHGRARCDRAVFIVPCFTADDRMQ